MAYFCPAEGFVFVWSDLSSSYFMASVFGVAVRKPFPTPRLKGTFPMFSSGVLCFLVMFYI